MARARLRTAAGMIAAALCAASCRAAAPQPRAPELQPAEHIDVGPLGYMAPSAFYTTYRLSSAAMGFFDDGHLLFTFRVGGLLKRLPEDRGDDDDQKIRAVVLDATSGQVIRQAEWRMHDRKQYLWPFRDGKFLVRIRNSLYLTDQSLVLEPYLTFNSALRVVQVSPDRQMMVVETSDPTKPHTGPSLESGEAADPVKVMIVPAGSREAIAVTETRMPTTLPLLSNGLVSILEGKQLSSWVMRAVPFHGQPKTIAEVKSTCQPSVQPLNAQVVLVAGCYGADEDRPVVAISADGKELWQDRWKNRYVWGWFDYAENGSRFVYESLAVSHSVTALDALYPSDITAQVAGVFDTESGNLVAVKNASPVLTAGQNAVLSPDGKRFAVLRNGAIEIYDLPPVKPPRPDGKKPSSALAERK